MPEQTDPLGGRLPLLDPGDLSGAQRELHDRIVATVVPWADAAPFRSTTAGGRLIGPFNPTLYSPAIASRFFDLQAAEEAHTTLGGRVRQVVILAVGAAWRADYALYAHAAVARKAGLSERAIRALAAGEAPDDLAEDEEIARRYATRLAAHHHVDDPLYRAAEAAFGRQGLVEIAFLAGLYQTVCGLLNGFAIPAPAPATPTDATPRARLTTVASFLPQFFLENLAIRRDNSMLITVATRRELWYLPPPRDGAQVDPMRLHAFDEVAMGIVELEDDVFYIVTGNIYTTHESHLHRLDLRGWAPGADARPEVVLTFPEPARGPNGCCAIAPDVLLVADCFAGLIWRLDFAEDGRPRPRVWLRHDTMKHDPDGPMPDQPGVNGVRFAPKAGYLYYTSTAQKGFLRVRVDPATRDPAGEPELVASGAMFDDFCLDEDAGFAYLSTHRENTIDRVPLEPGEGGGRRQAVAGRPFTEQLIGPSSGAWGRLPGEFGRVAYFLTDGGTKAPPPDGIPRSAKVLRVEF